MEVSENRRKWTGFGTAGERAVRSGIAVKKAGCHTGRQAFAGASKQADPGMWDSCGSRKRVVHQVEDPYPEGFLNKTGSAGKQKRLGRQEKLRTSELRNLPAVRRKRVCALRRRCIALGAAALILLTAAGVWIYQNKDTADRKRNAAETSGGSTVSGTGAAASSDAASNAAADIVQEDAAYTGQEDASSEYDYSMQGDASSEYDYSMQDALRGETKTADISAGILMLVNKDYSLPDDYEPELHWLNNKKCAVAEEMYDFLAEMLGDGTDEGLEFVVASGYRSIQKQKELLEEDIQADIANEGLTYEEAYEKETKETMPPGCSEHETGLAVDLVALSYQMLDSGQEQTAENQWLRKHCSEYGFILRYPEGKEDITGVNYESWHFRYVGTEAAKEITERGITLEEYLES